MSAIETKSLIDYEEEFPVREALIKLADRLPKQQKYYVVKIEGTDNPVKTIIANNLAEAYILYYDYENLTRTRRGNEYEWAQQVYDDTEEEGLLDEGEITLEWLNRFNDNEILWLEATDNLPVITREYNEELRSEKLYGFGGFVKSASKQ